MLRLYQLGADPEFLFIMSSPTGEKALFPACDLISKNKDAALASFIGTDNHSATAEFRPAPSHDINRIMLQLAHGISHVEDSLKLMRVPNVVMAVPPHIFQESLGGHIHVSFFVDDPFTRDVEAAGLYIGFAGGPVAHGGNATGGSLGNLMTGATEMYLARVKSKLTIGVQEFNETMDYLFAPLDFWVHDSEIRKQRMMKHGHNGPYGVPGALDNMRPGVSARPSRVDPAHKDHAYCHWEYRLPTVWLVHPWMAYLYLALAKRLMTNFMTVYDYRRDGHVVKFRGEVAKIIGSVTLNLEAEQLFKKRLEWFLAHSASTSDSADLEKAVDIVSRRWREWANRGSIYSHAWKELLS